MLLDFEVDLFFLSFGTAIVPCFLSTDVPWAFSLVFCFFSIDDFSDGCFLDGCLEIDFESFDFDLMDLDLLDI